MQTRSLADCYKLAGIPTNADQIKVRQKPLAKLSDQGLSQPQATELARIVFGIEIPGNLEWLVQPLTESDPSFSVIDGARELAVISTFLLEQAFAGGDRFAAVACVAATAAGRREPVIPNEIGVRAAQYLLDQSAASRHMAPIKPAQIATKPLKGKLLEQAAALAPNEWPKINELFKLVHEENTAAIGVLATQAVEVLRSVAAHIVRLEQDQDILAWHVGGWSRCWNRPFANETAGVVAVSAAIDLSDLTRGLAAPPAWRAVLQRTVQSARDGLSASDISFSDLVDSFSEEDISSLAIAAPSEMASGLCPVLGALHLRATLGQGTAWRASFARATGLQADWQLPVLDLAKQVYHERQLLKQPQ